MKNTIKTNELNTEKFYKLLNKFINESKRGIRLRTNGKRMGSDSIENYQTFKQLLLDFEVVPYIRIPPSLKVSKFPFSP